MNIEQALEKIKENWKSLKENSDKRASCMDDENILWVIDSDESASYDTDYEYVGMKENGALVWAYASGCSCWDGDWEIHETHDPKEFQMFGLRHDQVKESWQKTIIEFAESIK